MLRRISCVFALLFFRSLTEAQQSRTEEIERARDAKSAQAAPDAPGKWEERLIYIKDKKVLERISAGIAGFRLKIGGMATGGGFALGPNYFREDLARGELTIDAYTQASTSRWLKHHAGVAAPAFARNKLFWEAAATHINFASIPFYGLGPDSEKQRRTNYRLEDTAFDTWLGARPVKWLRFGVSTGHLSTNVGPGTTRPYSSADTVFRDIPGLDRQTSYGRAGFFAQADYRDSAIGPRAGGLYSFRYDDYSDRDARLYSFRRVDLEVQQLIPVFNKRRVFAVRSRAIQTFTDPGQAVPFYQQSVLGGDDLRGYRPYRFTGNNSILMNAEYRWEVFAGLDMAVFADAGRVSPRRWQFQFSQFESSVGFGMRFNVRNAPFLRFDAAFSHEGFQLLLKFNGPFQQRPLGTSGAPHVF